MVSYQYQWLIFTIPIYGDKHALSGMIPSAAKE